MHIKRLNHTYPIATRFSGRTSLAGNPKPKDVQLPAQRSWYSSNKTLEVLGLQNLITDFKVDVRCRCGPQSKVLHNQMPSMHTQTSQSCVCDPKGSSPCVVCQWRTDGGEGVQTAPPRNSEDTGGDLDRISKKNRHLDFLL